MERLLSGFGDKTRTVWQYLRWPLLGLLLMFLLLVLLGIVDTAAWQLIVLAISIGIAVGGWLLKKSQAETEQELARERQEEEILHQYFERIEDLLLNYSLRQATDDSGDGGEARVIAQSRTLNLLRKLKSPDRKSAVITFLANAELVTGDKPIISLEGTDLSYTPFHGVSLPGAILAGADLTKANLYSVDLTGARLNGAILTDANLVSATLNQVTFKNTDLNGADLSDAMLVEARFDGAKLDGAKLSGADLSGADLATVRIQAVELRHIKYTKGPKATVFPPGFKPEAVRALLLDGKGQLVEEPLEDIMPEVERTERERSEIEIEYQMGLAALQAEYPVKIKQAAARLDAREVVHLQQAYQDKKELLERKRELRLEQLDNQKERVPVKKARNEIEIEYQMGLATLDAEYPRKIRQAAGRLDALEVHRLQQTHKSQKSLLKRRRELRLAQLGIVDVDEEGNASEGKNQKGGD